MNFLCRGWLLLALGAAAPAQPTLSLRQAVMEAISSHPLLAVEEERVAAADGQRRQAGLMPNPKLVLQTENLRAHGNPGFRLWNDTDNFAYLQQTFETGGKRDRRRSLAEAEMRRAELEREMVSRQIAFRVKQAYWNALGLQRTYELLLEGAANFQQIVEYHEIRVREGAMAEADLLRVQLEAERLAIAANTAALEAELARIRLFREMGRSSFPDVRMTESLEVVDDRPPPADPARALEDRTEMKIARQAVAQAQANLELERAGARPNVDALLGYKRTGGLDTVVGGFQMDLPFLNRNQGNIFSATAGVRLAESSRAATEALIRAEVSAASRDYEIRRRQVTGTLPAMRQRAEQASGIARAAYREGGAELLRLLDAERVRIETQVLHVRTLSEYKRSVAALEAAMGAMP